jgi:hypothetical protein
LLEGILLDGTLNLVQFFAVMIEHIVQRIELQLFEQFLVVRVFKFYKNAVVIFEVLGQE